MAHPHFFRRRPVASSLLGLLIVLVAAFAWCEWKGWPFLREPLQRQLTQRLERPFEIGPAFRLHLLGSLRASSDRLLIGGPSWAEAKDAKFFEASDIRLQLRWPAIFRQVFRNDDDDPRPLEVALLDVASFDAVLWRRDDGRANWTFSDKPPAEPDREGAGMPEFERLVVRSGKLSFDDRKLDLRLKAEAATDEGEGGAGTDLRSSGLRVSGSGHYREGDFNFGLKSNGVLPLVSPGDSDETIPVTLQAKTPNGRFSFDGQAKDIVHLKALQGAFTLAGNSLAKVGEPFGITLPTTEAFDMKGRIGKDGDVWRADIARFAVGSSELAGEFRFDRTQAVPKLEGTLRGRNLALADLGPAFGTPAPGSGNPAPPSGKVLPQKPFDIPSLQRMNAAVAIDLQRADLGTALLQDLSPLKGRIQLDGGVLSITDLLARTAGGQVSGRLRLNGRQPQQPLWDGELRVAGVDLDSWLRPKNPRADAAKEGERANGYISGKLGAHFKFDGAGRSVAAMAASLDGTLTAWVRDGRVSHLAVEAAGLDIAQGIGLLLTKDKTLPMSCAVTRFNAKDGLMHADLGLIDTTDSTLLVGGDISLAEERLALVLQSKPKDFSPLALRSPLRVQGTFADPAVKLDVQKIGLRAVAAAALAAINPLAAVIPLIDAGERAPSDGCERALGALRAGKAVPAAGEGGPLLAAPADSPAAGSGKAARR